MAHTEYDTIIAKLNDPVLQNRLDAAKAVGLLIRGGKISREATAEVNNHIHTTYSFSPYEPAMAAFKAWQAGLQIVGSIDHDSISAASEMMAAGKEIGIATTVGFEVRCSFLDTALKDKKINNPDSRGIVYMCVHGVPAQHIEKVKEFLRPVNRIRNVRNQAEVNKLNSLIAGTGLELIDFDKDVAALSRAAEDGSITERHILSAFAGKIMDHCGKGEGVVAFLETKLGLPVTGKIREILSDENNPHYRYDLLGILKGSYLPQFFLQPETEETIPVRDVVSFGLEIGAIPAYAYLGDVTESPTGDKKAEKFEDSFLDELFQILATTGYPAVTYMPPRNSIKQLKRVQELAREYHMMEISGVDINSSRQQFNCKELLMSEFSHLIDSAWALVAHEKLSTIDQKYGLFNDDNPFASESLETRIARYATYGKKMDPNRPEDIIDLV